MPGAPASLDRQMNRVYLAKNSFEIKKAIISKGGAIIRGTIFGGNAVRNKVEPESLRITHVIPRHYFFLIKIAKIKLQNSTFLISETSPKNT